MANNVFLGINITFLKLGIKFLKLFINGFYLTLDLSPGCLMLKMMDLLSCFNPKSSSFFLLSFSIPNMNNECILTTAQPGSNFLYVEF